MKVAIMQPYFFPYIGYFSLIKNTDKFILFDTPQFIRHGWIERNRVINIHGEPYYLKVPLHKHSRNTPISKIKIRNDENWKEKILAQLTHYKRKAPNFDLVINLLKDVFDRYYETIVDLNYIALQLTCEYLELDADIDVFSQMNLSIDPANEPDEWALNISKALQARSYINPTGGMSFFDKIKYEQAGVELKFLNPILEPYRQFNNSDFVPGLSIIDVMMFNQAHEVKEMLNQFEYIVE